MMLDECTIFMRDPEGGGCMGLYNQVIKLLGAAKPFYMCLGKGFKCWEKVLKAN